MTNVPTPSKAELAVGFKIARQKIDAMAGWYASMVPDSDVHEIVAAVLAAAAQVRGNPSPQPGARP